jgi:nitroreductase
MELMDALRSRRACRAFEDEPVNAEAIEKLVEAAILAPSAMNMQPWAFVVIDGRARLHEMGVEARRAALEHLPEASPLHGHLSDQSFEIFHGAAALIIVCATDDQRQAAEDCCLAAGNLMLAARGLGLGTCWIGLSRPWLDLPAVKAKLGIPAEWQPVAPLVLGHPRHQPPATHRNRPKLIWAA